MKRPRLTARTAAERLSLAMASPTLEEVNKAHATRKLARQLRWQGLTISLEHDRGGVRRGVDPDGQAWETKMTVPYGYIRGTESGQDGDHLDVFVREDGLPGDYVWVIHTVKPGSNEYDEDKCFLGFESERDARDCFADHYDNPQAHFGAISILPVEDFVAYCKGGRDNWGRALVPRAAAKVHLARKGMERAEKAAQERRAWLRERVAAEKTLRDDMDDGLMPDPDVGEQAERDEDDAAALAASLVAKAEVAAEMEEVQKAASTAHRAIQNAHVSKVTGPEWTGKRVILIQPSWEAIDLQDEYVAKDVMRDAWPYYEACGNVDLEHLTKKGGATLEEYAAELARLGFPGHHGLAGRTFYEIGRPIPGTFDAESCSFMAEIYVGQPAADWWWSTAGTIPWKPSVGGGARYVKAVARNKDPRFGLNTDQEIRVMKLFRWNNVAMTEEPANHWVPPIEIVHTDTAQVSKGLTPMPDYTAADALKDAMLAAAHAAVQTMMDSDQVSFVAGTRMLGDVAKALDTLSSNELDTEVSKALDYGVVTTDSAGLTQGGAATYSGLSQYRKVKEADDLFEMTLKGATPFQEGFEWTDKAAPHLDIADFLMQQAGLDTDDALDVAELFLGRVQAHARGE